LNLKLRTLTGVVVVGCSVGCGFVDRFAEIGYRASESVEIILLKQLVFGPNFLGRHTCHITIFHKNSESSSCGSSRRGFLELLCRQKVFLAA
jgi:hypothetical protein